MVITSATTVDSVALPGCESGHKKNVIGITDRGANACAPCEVSATLTPYGGRADRGQRLRRRYNSATRRETVAVALSPEVMKRSLRLVPLLADLAEADLDTLTSSARHVSFKKGARIFEEGAEADCCFVLTSGRARVVLAGSGGSEIVLNILTPPALVGEIALLDRSTRSASMVAADDCLLIRINAVAFQSLRANRNFEDRLVARLVSTIRRSDDRVRVISSFSTIKRVAWSLGRLASVSGIRDGNTVTLPKTSHQELSEMAACTRETVTRALQKLRKKNYVMEDSRTLRIDLVAMQRYLTTDLTG
jgi:CRP/FNR family cyclic AMP-dependent transcriptional regulator